jgi:hypothetical protein
MNGPYPKSWWVNQGQILAGRYPGDLNPDVQPQEVIRPKAKSRFTRRCFLVRRDASTNSL